MGFQDLSKLAKDWAGKLGLSLAYVLAKSGLDYSVCMRFSTAYCGGKPENPYLISPIVGEISKGALISWSVYSSAMTLAGLGASAVYGLMRRDWNEGVRSVPFFGAGTYLAEQGFYCFVNHFGDLNKCYHWYTGNPLNPDGHWGYEWTNPLGMAGYAGLILSIYGTTFVVSRGLLRKRNESS